MKRYISDAIDREEYSTWLNGKKIIVDAPTGTGKTTFVLKDFLPFCAHWKKKVLILCNRRLLREQYRFELAKDYSRYAQMCDEVEVKTYQEIAEQLKNGKNVDFLLEGIDVVVCDETHFFYSDSDFNGFGTYVLLQALIMAGIYKTFVFVTATFEEVFPLIEKTLEQCARRLGIENPGVVALDKRYDFQSWAEYDRFSCYYAEDVETICDEIIKSAKKTLMFIDDKQKAENIKNFLIKTGKLKAGDIFILNAQILEENPENKIIQRLSICHKVLPKVLITTSVLDNGVSIHDAEVGNVIIATESKVSFQQMLGRIRGEEGGGCRLYIFPRNSEYYEKRLKQISEKLKCIDFCEQQLQKEIFTLVTCGWYANDDKAGFVRNIVVFTKEQYEYYGELQRSIRISGGEITLSINEFAKEKTGNLLLAYENFFRLSLEAPEAVAKMQIAWIGKKPEELAYITSTYREERVKALTATLLEIQNYTLDDLKKTKEKIAREYRQDLIGDIVTKSESFSTDKLEGICKRYGLVLETELGIDKKKHYYVKRKRKQKSHTQNDINEEETDG